MPVAGIIAGRFVGERFAVFAEILGGLILVGIGIHAFLEAREGGGDAERLSFQSLRSALLAGVAISMDELAVGFPLGAVRLPIVTVLVAIAIQAFLVTTAGVIIGARIGQASGRTASRYARVIAASAFSAVGVWLIIEALVRG
jgi:putative Mn2+ efflux pump MntP